MEPRVRRETVYAGTFDGIEDYIEDNHTPAEEFIEIDEAGEVCNFGDPATTIRLLVGALRSVPPVSKGRGKLTVLNAAEALRSAGLTADKLDWGWDYFHDLDPGVLEDLCLGAFEVLTGERFLPHRGIFIRGDRVYVSRPVYVWPRIPARSPTPAPKPATNVPDWRILARQLASDAAAYPA